MSVAQLTIVSAFATKDEFMRKLPFFINSGLHCVFFCHVSDNNIPHTSAATSAESAAFLPEGDEIESESESEPDSEPDPRGSERGQLAAACAPYPQFLLRTFAADNYTDSEHYKVACLRAAVDICGYTPACFLWIDAAMCVTDERTEGLLRACGATMATEADDDGGKVGADDRVVMMHAQVMWANHRAIRTWWSLYERHFAAWHADQPTTRQAADDPPFWAFLETVADWHPVRHSGVL